MENSDFFQRIRLTGNPQAHPAATVMRGNVRFTVLTPRLLRLEWSPTGEFTDFATFAFPQRFVAQPPHFELWEDAEQLRIDTGALTLTYHLNSGAFTAANLAITLRYGDTTQTWRPGQADDGNLRGTRRTIDLTGGDVPLEPGLISRAGWAVYDDSAGVVLQPDDGWVNARPPQSLQDWYFFGYGHDYAAALADYTRFGGAVPLIPRYVLGIWWSRFWPYSATDLEQLVTDFADHGLPLDVLVVDMDWHTPGHWTGYSWNHDLFPDPATFLATMHARGLLVTLNLHPADGVHSHEAAYPALAAALGVDAAANAPIPFRIADRLFAERYFSLLHHPLEEQGVDFWWIDWQQGESTEVVGLDPLMWLNHLHFADARRRGQRPLLFSRWGGLGNHRYPIGFSGDTFGGWATLAALPRFTATAANVGFGWWSHDIGGHYGAADAEIFTRWVQFGVLSPCLRLHAVKHLLADRRPWAYPAPVLDAVRAAFALRYQLVPYLYSMARHTFEQGIAICRPMYYAFPEEDSAYLAHGQYQLGNDLIAAPITQPADPATGLAAIDVWIPPGTWYRFDSGEAFVGPRWLHLDGDLATIPLFARAGAIVPLAHPAPHLVDVPADVLDIRVFPGADGALRLYEDDNVSEAYLQAAYEWTTITYTAGEANRRVLHIAPTEGHCPSLPTARAYNITFVGVTAPQRVVDEHGNALSWSFDQGSRNLTLTLPHRSKQDATTVTLDWLATTTVAPQSTQPPFAHVVPYTASDEAARQLAQLVLVPPVAADRTIPPCDVTIVWRNFNYAGVTAIQQTVPDLSGETIITAPFQRDQTLQPHHWEVMTQFTTGDATMTATYSGPYIHPPIQRWQVRYAGHDDWIEMAADLQTHLTITEPFEVQLDAQVAPMAEAVAYIDIAEAVPVWFDTWGNGSLALEIDAKPLEAGQPMSALAGLARPWPIHRCGPVTLAAGRHAIRVHLTAPMEPPWRFGVLIADEAGKPLARCLNVAATESS